MRYYQHAIRAIGLDDRIKLLKTFALTDGGEHLDPDCLCLLQTVVLAEDGNTDSTFCNAITDMAQQ